MGLILGGEGGAEVKGGDGEDGGGYVATVGDWRGGLAVQYMRRRLFTTAYAPLVWKVPFISVGVDSFDLDRFGEGRHARELQDYLTISQEYA